MSGAHPQADRVLSASPTEPLRVSSRSGNAPLRVVSQFACLCGCQSEGHGDPPACWDCGKPMHQWGTREVCGHSTVITNAVAADTRTANGGLL